MSASTHRGRSQISGRTRRSRPRPPRIEDPYPSRQDHVERVAPRREPVLWGGLERARDRGLLARFERDGFVVLEEVFDSNEVAALAAAAERIRWDPDRFEPGTTVLEPHEEVRELRSAFAIHRQLDAFGMLARDERLVGLAREILDDDVYVNQSRLNFKPAFRGKGFYWHSDFETWHVEDGMSRMRAVSMSVMLTDNHPQSGPTMFIPGSHKTFFGCAGQTPDENYKFSLRRQQLGVPSDGVLARLVEENGLAAPAPKAGSVVVFDCNTLHGSAENITPIERVNAFFVYNAWSNRLVAPFGGTRPRPEYLAHRRLRRSL